MLLLYLYLGVSADGLGTLYNLSLLSIGFRGKSGELSLSNGGESLKPCEYIQFFKIMEGRREDRERHA